MNSAALKTAPLLFISQRPGDQMIEQAALQLKSELVTIPDLSQAREYLYNTAPLAILLGSDLADWQVWLQGLKQNLVFKHLPVIVVLFDTGVFSLQQLAELPADDWLFHTDSSLELRLRITKSMRQLSAYLDANPLTRLPGNSSIVENVNARIESGQDFGLAYIDIDNFKAFNDYYGFSRGDDLIRMTARILGNLRQSHSAADLFSGHIGGDDFVCIARAADMAGICDEIISNFGIIAQAICDADDVKRGHFRITDRHGIERDF
ncbi:MAG: diguanylate cyclase, partial [Leptospiraceae bacterium]|nr:diguanylate cyclase [Leptospiraceae bacterium]